LANGCSDTSDCIVINDLGVEEQSNYFTLFPNPGNGTFSLNSSQAEIKEIEIFDLTGRKQVINYSEDEITLLSDAKGLFFVHITTENGTEIVTSYLKE
jgi:hypothetical protein